jgi:hypothetical protein
MNSISDEMVYNDALENFQRAVQFGSNEDRKEALSLLLTVSRWYTNCPSLDEQSNEPEAKRTKQG